MFDSIDDTVLTQIAAMYAVKDVVQIPARLIAKDIEAKIAPIYDDFKKNIRSVFSDQERELGEREREERRVYVTEEEKLKAESLLKEQQEKEEIARLEERLKELRSKELQSKEDFNKAEADAKELQKKEFFEKQDEQIKEMQAKDEFWKADALEKERQAKEFFAKQDDEKKQALEQQQVRDQEYSRDAEYSRQNLEREQAAQHEAALKEIELQKDRDMQRQEDERAQRVREDQGLIEKPKWDQVVEAERVRNENELRYVREGHEEALTDMLKNADRDNHDAMREAAEERLQQDLERKRQEQEERMNRLELLYKGAPSDRER